MSKPAALSLTWTNEKRKLGELIPWDRNPRQIKRDQAKRLRESFEEFGQVEPIAIGPSNELYNGHQRLSVLMEHYGPDYEIEVRVSSRPLTEKEREKLTIFLHKGAAGEWNFDVLANEFDLDELLEWGFSEKELQVVAPDENEGKDILLDQAIQLEPAKEFVVVMCADDDEFVELRRLLNLQEVRRGGYRPGSPFDAVGVQRVVLASTLIELLEK